MLARVFKQQNATAFTAFQFPNIGEPQPQQQPQPQQHGEIVETFDLADTVEFEPFVEVEREYPAAATIAGTEDILRDAQEQAAQILAQAEEKFELIEQVAYDKAVQEARKNVEAEIAEKIRDIRENFTESMRDVARLREETSVRVEKDIVELALEIAKKIVGREVMFDREIALTLVKVSLKKIHSRALAQIHLNAEDLAFVQSRRDQIDFRGSLEFIEDRSISPGGCLIHTETGDIDATIESQFEEVAHALLGK